MIQSPFAWLGDRLDRAYRVVGSASDEEYWQENRRAAGVTVRRIGLGDLGQALRGGLADFGANRTDVIFLCVIYPLIGLVLARLASGYDVVPLLFPLASGFALVGPLAAVGLNEMSRRREAGAEVNWVDWFGVLRSPSIGAIVGLGLWLIDSATTANRKPTPTPTTIIVQPCGVVSTSRTKVGIDAGGSGPSVAT